jgi:hypothetical protein
MIPVEPKLVQGITIVTRGFQTVFTGTANGVVLSFKLSFIKGNTTVMSICMSNSKAPVVAHRVYPGLPACAGYLAGDPCVRPLSETQVG